MTTIELHVSYKGQRNATVFTKNTIEEARELVASLSKLPTFVSAKAVQVVRTAVEL